MSIPLPGWMNGEVREAWEEYVAQRIKDKKAMSPRSMVQRIKRLQQLKDAGFDPLVCLDEALNGHWLDFYSPKDKQIQMTAEASYEQQQKREREEAERRKRETFSPQSEAARAEAMAKIRGVLKVVGR